MSQKTDKHYSVICTTWNSGKSKKKNTHERERNEDEHTKQTTGEYTGIKTKITINKSEK